jgi:hypothetical protein
MRIFQRFGLLLGTFGLIFVAFLVFVRPWYLQWGSTEAEQQLVLPGDDIVRGDHTQNTRAITIHAPAEQIWPWLAQTGQDRGGFYSYDRLENLFGCEMPDPDALLPDKQHWQVGDKLWMYPPDKAGGQGFATLRVIVPGRVLAFGTRMFGTTLSEPENGAWIFALQPIDASTTRLLVRGHGTTARSLLGTAFDRSIFEPVHFAMERRMMIGIKGMAEGTPPSQLVDDLQIALWAITFVLIGITKGLVIFQDRWERPLAGFAASLIVFQILTLVQPHVLVGTFLVAAIAAIVWWPSRATTAQQAGDRAAVAGGDTTSVV